MTSLTGLIAVNHAFAALAARVGMEASVRSDIWPTAGEMIDHLGNIQAWATRVVRTGGPADRALFTRPPERERVEWFRQTSDALVDALETTDPARACWTIWGAEPIVSFWRRRMTHEAAKHLWDLRTAIEPDPPMPQEISPEAQAGVIDEFAELLVPTARARGIDPLPRDVVLVADDLDRAWMFSREWAVTTSRPADLASPLDADVMHAAVGDLVLFVWERADPWDLPDRFHVAADDAALRAFSSARVHV